MENADELYMFLKEQCAFNESESFEYLNMLYEADFKTFDQIFDRFDDFKKHQFRMPAESQAKIINALFKHKHDILAGYADNYNMTTLQGPPSSVPFQTIPFQKEIIIKKGQVEEEKTESFITEEV